MSCTRGFLFPCADECRIKRPNKRAVRLAASAFQSLEPEEQDRVARDLYGTEEPAEETIDFVRNKLQGLDEELNKLPSNVTKYYTRAIHMERQKLDSSRGKEEVEYATSEKFRLMFLRAERFDTKKAARRLTSYFHEKYFLFGEEVLSRKIKQEDFNDGEMKPLLLGAFSFTGETDLAGRPLLLIRRRISMKQDVISMKKCSFYMFQNMLEDNDEAQQKGFVIILDNINSPISFVASEIRRVISLPRLANHTIPCRMVGLHNLYNDMKEHLVMNFVLAVFPRDMRARFQFHYLMTHEECMCTLMDYGIHFSDLPITIDGKLRYEVIRDYWERQRQLEC